jgi:hypothetical protein
MLIEPRTPPHSLPFPPPLYDTPQPSTPPQMSDVLQLDFFTCASLMIEAREDFDTAEHKPVVRGLVAYYGAMSSMLRAVFYLMRLRRDSRRCPVTPLVDELLRTIGLGSASLDGLLTMAADDGVVAEHVRASVPTVALEAELQCVNLLFRRPPTHSPTHLPPPHIPTHLPTYLHHHSPLTTTVITITQVPHVVPHAGLAAKTVVLGRRYGGPRARGALWRTRVCSASAGRLCVSGISSHLRITTSCVRA